MTRNVLLAAVTTVFVLAAGIYFAPSRRDRVAVVPHLPAAMAAADGVIEPPFIMFRALAPREAHGRVSMVSAAAPALTRYVSKLACTRVHYAAGTGICFIEEPEGTTIKHVALFFDRQFKGGARFALSGLPIRARLSPDGRRAAITVYGEEHLPSGAERLATDTVIVDVGTGRVVADLGQFAVESSSAQLTGPLDVSSVAFGPDADRFYATLSTDVERYLVVGSLAGRRLKVVATGSASEALSPDGKRLVIKKRVGNRGSWQLLVLDLATQREQALNQGQRSVDDQVEWLDDEHVVYHEATGEGTGIWVVAADGQTPPRLLVADAYSPSVQR